MLGVGMLARYLPSRWNITCVTLMLVMVSVLHTVPWVLANTASSRGLERYLSLLRVEPVWSTFARASGNDDLAEYLFDRGQNQAAISACEEALRLAEIAHSSPAGKDRVVAPRCFLRWGMVLHDQAALEQAISVTERGVRLSPDDFRGHYSLGRWYEEKQLYDRAIAEYTKAIAIDPSNAAVHISLGVAYDATGRLDLAIREFSRAIELDPERQLAHFNLGVLYQRTKRYDKAIEAYRQSIQIDPTNADVHSNLGTVYEQMGMPERAAEAYLDALRIKPALPAAHLGLGRSYEALSRDPNVTRREREQLTEKAINSYQRFIRVWRGDPRHVEEAEERIARLRSGR
jgi:tetratricopeptide (TPR) repeat protein